MATRAEQETVIRWDRDEQLVHVWSADPVVWRRMARLGFVVREETRYAKTGEVSGRFYVPIPLADFRWGKRRQSSPAQRAAGQKAIEKAREAYGRQKVNGGT